jgi:hypothetical protein
MIKLGNLVPKGEVIMPNMAFERDAPKAARPSTLR